MQKSELQNFIRDVVDFPKKGIIFKDITPLLQNKDAFHSALDWLAEPFRDEKIDAIVAIESRGFIFGGALADRLGTGFVPVRKKGKLPSKIVDVTYELEYGSDVLEMHEDAIKPGSRVLIVDDLLATGGTVKATADLVTRQRGQIAGIVFLIELTFLKGREKLGDWSIHSLLRV